MGWIEGEIVEVEWVDAYHHESSSGISKSELLASEKGPYLRREYGILLASTAQHVIVGSQARGDDDLPEPLFLRWMVIPRGIVLKVTKLKRAE